MIALYKGISSFSRLIRFRTWDQYSHAAWHEPDQSGWEAWKGVGVRHFQHFSECHSPGTEISLYDFRRPLRQFEHQLLLAFFRSQEGKPYDTRGALHFVTRRSEDPASLESWFCSELIFAACLFIRRPLLLRIPAWKVYPSLLAYSPTLRYVGRQCVEARR